jgi:hypothetical protein
MGLRAHNWAPTCASRYREIVIGIVVTVLSVFQVWVRGTGWLVCARASVPVCHGDPNVCVCVCVFVPCVCACVCVCVCVCAAFKSRNQNGAMTECDNEWHTRETLN